MNENNIDLVQILRERIQNAFDVTHLEIVDESVKHIGHSGNQGGGHFKIVISATEFQNVSRVAAHRKIYALFEDLLPQQIHALSIYIV